MAHFSKVYSAQAVGLTSHIISVETDITKKTLQAFSIVGLPDKAVEESRDRVSAAIKNSGFTSPKNINYKTVVSLAPADLKKEGPLFDIAIAVGYLLADKKIFFEAEDKIFLGELSLDGAVRPIRGALALAREAKQKGFKQLYIPKENEREAALIDGIEIFGISSLRELLAHINSKRTYDNKHIAQSVCLPCRHKIVLNDDIAEPSVDFSDVRGQESAKRGIEIAAAGGHNIAMYGPPGTGKTMLAKAFSGIIPKLNFEEMLEVTGIHSISGALDGNIVSAPPFRAPHHTSSYTAIVGGGAFPRPGEITLAHRGVLFLDEFPEFDRRVMESLRQPLEDRVIYVSRTKGTECFPASFILIAAMNPCPCGNAGTAGKICSCSPSSLARYGRKISGPIMDRIDIWVEVGSIEHKKLLDVVRGEKTSSDIRDRVQKARDIQIRRYSECSRNTRTNAEMGARELTELISLSKESADILNSSAKRFSLSPRAYHRVIKVARTIADLEGSAEIDSGHIMEALQYRPRIAQI